MTLGEFRALTSALPDTAQLHIGTEQNDQHNAVLEEAVVLATVITEVGEVWLELDR